MKIIIKFWLLIMLFSLTASLMGQVRPDGFPMEANPDSTNFEVYSQKGGQIKRANLFALKKYFSPFVKSVGFVPSATGNTSHLAEFVSAPNGKTYYIDGKGNSVQVFGTQDIHTDATLTGDGTNGSPLHVEGELTDDQNLSDGGRSGTIQNISIEDGTGVSFDVADNDNDPENEIQTISKDSNTRIVTLSDSGGTFVDEVDDIDHDTLNEIQDLAIDTLTDSLSISQGNKVYLGYLMGRDSQKLELVNDTLSIENGNWVYLGYLEGRDSQTISIVNDTLWIENGNGVSLKSFDKQSLKFIDKTGSIVNIGIERGDSIFININDADSSVINELQDLTFDESTDSLHIQYGNTIYLGSLKGDNQDLTDGGRSGTNQTVNITNGNGVVFDVADNDNDPENEYQSLSVSGNQLTISNRNTVTLDPNDADSNPLNEIQSLSLSGTVLCISGGNCVTLPSGDGSGSTGDNWGTDSVVSDSTLVGNGTGADTLRVNIALSTFQAQNLNYNSATNELSIDRGNTVTLDPNDADSDPTNELQTISKSGSTVTLSDAGGSFTDEVNDADSDPGNEIETASNIGTGSEVYKQKTGSNFEFRKLKSSDGSVTITQGADDIDIKATGTGSGDDWGAQVVEHDGSLTGDGTSANELKVDPITVNTFDDSHQFHLPDALGNTLAFDGIGDISVTTPSDGSHVVRIEYTGSGGGGGDNWGTQVVQVGAGVSGDGTSGNPIVATDDSPTNEIETGANIGGYSEVYKDKLGSTFRFRTLRSSDGSVTITQNSNDIDLKATGSGGGDNWGSQVVQVGAGVSGDGTSGNPIVAADVSATNEDNTASNLGGYTEVYKSKSGLDLQFRTLRSSDGSVTITQGANDIDFKATGSGGGDNWGSQVVQVGAGVSGDGTSGNPIVAADVSATNEDNTASNLGGYTEVYKSKSGLDLQFRTLRSSDGSVTITQNTNDIDLKATGSGGGDNWGSQVVQVGAGVSGDGTSGNPIVAADDSPTNEIETASNIGTGSEVYKQKIGSNFEFRKLRSSDGSVTITQGANDIDLKATGTGGGDNWGSQVVQTDGTLTGDGTSGSPLHAVGSDDGDWVDDTNGMHSRSGDNLGIKRLSQSLYALSILGNVEIDGVLNLDDGTNSVFIGEQSGYSNTGSRNIGIGYRVLRKVTSGQRNVANGSYALYNNLEGSFNMAIGYSALYNNTKSFNVAIGSQSLYGNVNGTNNTAVGYGSLLENAGSGNIALGSNAGYHELGSNTLYIENSDSGKDNALIYGEFDNNILRVNGQLQLGLLPSGRYFFPTAKGVSGQVMKLDGSGYLTWQDDNAGSGGDDWGSQVVQTGAGVSGDGTSGNPIVADDVSAANELQTISKSGSTVTLSNGGGTFTDEVDDADASATNEIQNLDQVTTEGNTTTNDATFANLTIKKVNATLELYNNSGSGGRWKMYINDSDDDLYFQPTSLNSDKLKIKSRSGNAQFQYNTTSGTTGFTNASNISALDIIPSSYRLTVNNSSSHQSIGLLGDTRQIKLGSDLGSQYESMVVGSSGALEYKDQRNYYAKMLGTSGTYNLTSSYTLVPFGNDAINSGHFTFNDALDRLEYNEDGVYKTCFEASVEYTGSSNSVIEFKIEYNGSSTVFPLYAHSVHDFDASNNEKVYAHFCNERSISVGDYVRVKGQGQNISVTNYKLTTEKIY